MPSPVLPVFWIGGAPAAGKSVTAWALFEKLGAEGFTVAYVDIDQLGMLYPDDKADSGGYRLKTDALNALIPNYVAAGAQVLIVSGVLDPRSPVDLASYYPQATVTFGLLSPHPDTLRLRIIDRDNGTDVDEVIAHASALTRAQFPHTAIDPGRMSVAEVVEQASLLVETIERGPEPSHSPTVRPRVNVPVVAITGPRAVGTSTVGFGLASTAWRRGIATGFADLDQLSFLRAPGATDRLNSRLGIENLAALHAVFASSGAKWLVVSSHLADQTDYALLRTCVAHAPCRLVRLHADAVTLAAHVQERTRGAGPRLARDDLKDADSVCQERVVEEAMAHQRALDEHPGEDLLIDVSGRTADYIIAETAEHVLAQWEIPF